MKPRVTEILRGAGKMTEKVLDGIQAATKCVASIGTTIGVFSLEMVLIGKSDPFPGAAKITTTICKAGKLIGLPTLGGGLTVMVGTSTMAGHAAGEAVDRLFDLIRGTNKSAVYAAVGTVQ